MIKNILLIFLSIVSLSCVAQMRNKVQILGLRYDNWSIGDNFTGLGEGLKISGRYSLSTGYERLVGDRLSVGLTYDFIIPSDFTFTGYNSNYSPLKNNASFQSLDYSFKGYTLGYESRYYFQEFELDGAEGLYIGFNYQYTSVTENIENGIADGGGTLPKFQTSNFGVNRFGVKLGMQGTGIGGNHNAIDVYLIEKGKIDLSLGLFYNMPTGAKDKMWISPIDINNISINVSCVVGLPF